MNSEEYLGKIINVKIDRPFGSKHPKHGFIYPVNYGYVPNTVSGDGEELDAYLLGVFSPVKESFNEFRHYIIYVSRIIFGIKII